MCVYVFVCMCVRALACTRIGRASITNGKRSPIPDNGCRTVALVQIAVESLSTLAADNARAPRTPTTIVPDRDDVDVDVLDVDIADPVGERLTCGRAVVAAAIVEHDPDTMFFFRSIAGHASALARFCAQLLVVQARGHYGQCLDAGYGAAAAAVCCHGHQHRIAPLEVNGQR